MINLERNEVEALKAMAKRDLNNSNAKAVAASIIHEELIKCGLLAYGSSDTSNLTVTPAAAGDKLAD
jgi:hypothetical protein